MKSYKSLDESNSQLLAIITSANNLIPNYGNNQFDKNELKQMEQEMF